MRNHSISGYLICCLILTAAGFWNGFVSVVHGDAPKDDERAVIWKQQPQKYWRQRLSEEQFRVCREAGTERSYSGKFNVFKEKGAFVCSSCGQVLFSSKTKYDSKTGWPSFWDVIDKAHVEFHDDYKLFIKRTEIKCSRCGAHLGHLFNDGPPPTQQRYCINSVCLDFVPDKSN